MATATETAPRPVRNLQAEDLSQPRPAYAVWEVTLACDQPCKHCGSRAGRKRDGELSLEEMFEVAAALGRLGCREVALIGGEAYLRKDLPQLIAELHRLGMRVVMQTGGRKLTRERCRIYKQAGLTGVGVSIDGPRHVHDELRGNGGSYDAAMQALENARAEGLIVTANTQINSLSMPYIREHFHALVARGMRTWQVQLTTPMGEAADRPEWLIEPWQIIEVVETLAELQREAIAKASATGTEPVNIFANNNIGYFGPHEATLRTRPGMRPAHWRGCLAGIAVLGIESDGTIKGCPSLPTTPYAGGNVRDLSLERIWQESEKVRFARDRTSDELWGFCKTCYYADTCRAGCSWMAHTALGRRGNNPFCYHRATQLKRRGLRERLVVKERAPGAPYDFGRLELVEEPWGARAEPNRDPRPQSAPTAKRRLPLIAS